MPRLSMVEAIRDAMDCKMAEDERVVVFGEDVGYFGGVFRCTEGLQRKYGKSRCFDAPINELGIVGVAIGMGGYGLRRSSKSSSPTMSIRARPDRVGGGAAALPLGRKGEAVSCEPHDDAP